MIWGLNPFVVTWWKNARWWPHFNITTSRKRKSMKEWHLGFCAFREVCKKRGSLKVNSEDKQEAGGYRGLLLGFSFHKSETYICDRYTTTYHLYLVSFVSKLRIYVDVLFLVSGGEFQKDFCWIIQRFHALQVANIDKKKISTFKVPLKK